MRRSLLRRPSAIIPIVMSLAALSLVLVHVARYGFVQESDEGTSAHLFQLLMVAQVPVVALFAFRWLPESPRQALIVLAIQFGAGAAALVALFVCEQLSRGA